MISNKKTMRPNIKIKNYLIIGLAILILFFFTDKIFAAKITIDSKNQEINTGDQFEVNIFLDTDEEYINAAEGKIAFPKDLLELKEIRDGNSIVNFWIERPRIESENTIIFSGITPGGYIGDKGLIFSVIFQAKKEGEGTVEISDAKVLLNDGKGTEANLAISNLNFLISQQAPPSSISEIQDTDPPELFELVIAQDPNIFDGKWFLVFATQDKRSGIDHYEILEKGQRGSFQELIWKEKWQIAESPYLLKDQELKSYISVKAVDKSGNERIVTLAPQNPISWHENYLIWLIIILVTIIIIITGAIGLYIRKKILWKGKIN
jgi:hypothetical protein